MQTKGKFFLFLIFPTYVLLVFLFYYNKTSYLSYLKNKGYITVITRNNANCYYLYRDEPTGFEYDLAKEFAEFLHLKLKVILPLWNDMFLYLKKKKGDFIAAGLTITDLRKEIVDFSKPYMKVRQMIIINKRNKSIKDIFDLKGKEIHIRRGTTYFNTLVKLNYKYNLNLKIVLHEDIPTEEFIRMVAQNKIEVTVADSNIALLNKRYYPDIKIAFPISDYQYLAWAVKKGNKSLLLKINSFFEKIKKDGTFKKIYDRYYSFVQIYDYLDLKKFQRIINTRLPRYKDLIEDVAKRYGFDWRLIAAIIYQESHFNPYAKSFTGVRGLMQITLRTAYEMGIKNRLDPKQSIIAGVKYLKVLYERWKNIPSSDDRLFFTLASYNVGYYHVMDARKLAKEMGLDPNKWESIKKTLPLLAYPKYYRRLKYGYARGWEPVRFVKRVMLYYDILKHYNVFKEKTSL